MGLGRLVWSFCRGGRNVVLLATEEEEKYIVSFETASGHGRLDSMYAVRMPSRSALKLPLQDRRWCRVASRFSRSGHNKHITDIYHQLRRRLPHPPHPIHHRNLRRLRIPALSSQRPHHRRLHRNARRSAFLGPQRGCDRAQARLQLFPAHQQYLYDRCWGVS
jgi:hypothetical protein